VHWAELNNGLSTEWKAHPEDKVQGTRVYMKYVWRLPVPMSVPEVRVEIM